MKPQSTLFLAAAIGVAGIFTATAVQAQKQYKLRQVTSMMGMKSETTIYVKGMRKRTEGGGYTGQPNNLVTIEQCDKQRTITLNDKKKLYYIEPFSKEPEEVIDEDARPAAIKTKPAPAQNKTGGVITMYYNITDTGERKKMFDFTARHIWTTQKMKPSPEACSMKDSMIIKTDGWYIDLPEFNCPVRYTPTATGANRQYQKPDCQDKYVTRRSGKGKLGFALIEKRTMIMGNGPAQTSEFVTDLETLELTTGKLDSMLFEIPPGYTEAKSAEELQDKFDVNAYIKEAQQQNNSNNNTVPAIVGQEKKPGMTRIGVFAPTGGESVQPSPLQQQLVSTLTQGNVEAIAVASEEEARQYHCDLVLSTAFTRFKQGSKVGGLLKAIKNTDPGASSSFNIDAVLTVTKLADGSTRLEKKLSGKYDGKPDEAARKSMEEGGQLVLKGLQ